MVHAMGGFFHFAVILRKVSQMSVVAAGSVGTWYRSHQAAHRSSRWNQERNRHRTGMGAVSEVSIRQSWQELVARRDSIDG